MTKLFWATGTCALASHIALEEAGAKYETVKLDFSQGDQRKPGYLKINPKGRVPALVTERGILTETPAILAWIAQTPWGPRGVPIDQVHVEPLSGQPFRCRHSDSSGSAGDDDHGARYSQSWSRLLIGEGLPD